MYKLRKTPIGDIPKDWEVVRLGEVAEIRRGASPRPKGDPRYFGGDIPWIKISDISKYKKGLYLLKTDDTVTEEGKKKSVYCPDGTLIVSNSGTIGEPAIIRTGKGGCIHDGFILVNPVSKADKIFLYYFFEAKKEELHAKAQKGTQGNMNTKLWKMTTLPLPPLPEQKKIAEILRTVDDAIEKTDEAIERTERLKKGLMQRLLTKGIEHERFKKTELGEIPEEWEVVKVEDIITEAKPGFASGKRDENGIIQLRMNNITTDGRVVLDQYLKVPIPKNINDYLLRPGDVLFNNTNSVDLLGKSAVFRGECEFCTYSNHITRLRVKNDVTIPEWLVYNFIRLWQMQYFKQIAIRHVGQAGIRKFDLLNIKLPLPPLEEQKQIAEILSTVDKKLELLRQRREKLERVKRGLMKDLLTGRRRVKV
ncbi:restriction endonuclease subunit S [Thermococcus sp.]|uniref:restriction endonuclease subunit S n=1 Tax=Thermococcus sp. TaxID=35749 RepID=UPI0026199E02|nr:restriction endonuclease subunit S [Thermococcus sp.]